jgi:hypothetical protein
VETKTIILSQKENIHNFYIKMFQTHYSPAIQRLIDVLKKNISDKEWTIIGEFVNSSASQILDPETCSNNFSSLRLNLGRLLIYLQTNGCQIAIPVNYE